MCERSKIIDRAKKLQELANRGVGGEKENAKEILAGVKKKYNITDAELAGHKYSESFLKETEGMNDKEILALVFSALVLVVLGMIFKKLIK